MVATPADPGEALWIGAAGGKNHFNVGIGNTASGEATHTDFSQSDIEGGYEQDPEFELTGDRLGVVFKINAGAGKTSANTKFPRCELREFQPNGTTRAAWDGRTGDHYMKGRSRITDFTAQRPWVCFTQIHDAESDLVRVQTEGTAGQTTNLDIVARRTPPGGDEIRTVLRGGYDINDWVNWELRITAGRLRIWLDSVLELDVTGMGNTGCYFKCGNYLQSNVADYGESGSDTSTVEIEAGSLQCWHTGYANPTTPVFTGPDGGSVGDNTPPSIPTNLVAIHGDQQVSLTWNGSTDDTGIDHYNVYRDPGPPTSDTFGKLADGASNSTSSADKIAASLFTPTDSGTLTAGHARVWVSATASPGSRLVVYADSAGSPAALLATSDETIVSNTSEAVKDYTFSGANQISIVSGTPYWLGIMWDDPGTPNFTWSRDGTASQRVEQQGFSYPAAPNPFGTPSATGTGPIDVWVVTEAPGGLGLLDTTTSTTYLDTGLVNGDEYTYTVSAEDAAGNESGQADLVTATPGPPDVTAPSVPTGLTATAGDKRVTLSWTASTDDTAVTGYLVYRGGVNIATPTTTSYVDTGVTNGTQYSYTVSARDAAGNESAQASAALATPLAPAIGGVEFLTNARGESLRLEVGIAFGADLSADPSTWAWTDVTEHVRQDPGISTSLGRNDEASTSNPATLSLVLDNTSGDYSLGGQSAHWPNVRRNTPVRVRVDPTDLAGARVLFFGFADGFTPGWDSLNGRIPLVKLSASGVLRRLEQGDAPIQSAYRRTMTERPSVVAYWPFEEGENSTYAPAVRGGSNFTFTGVPDWEASDDFDCSAALPQMRNAVFNADVTPYTDTGESQVRFLLMLPENADPTGGVVLAHISTTGTIIRWDIVYDLVNGVPSLGLFIYNNDGTLHSSSTVGFSGVDGIPVRLSLDLNQNGSDIVWTMGYKDAPGAFPTAFFTNGTVTSKTVGIVSHIEINPHGTAGDIVFGHVTVENEITSLFSDLAALVAHLGETATGNGRLNRLCDENDVPLTVYAVSEALSDNDRMGRQLVGPLLELLRECETSDQGQLWDGREAGLSYTTRRRREDGTVRLTIDARDGELAGPLDPVDDDQRNLNRVAATLKGGVTAIHEDATGPLGTAAIGVYDSSLTVNNRYDAMAPQYAAWLVHLGTTEGYRYPSVSIDARVSPHLVPAALDIVPGERIDVVGLDDTLAAFPTGTVSLIVEGIAHSIVGKTWLITFKCSPFNPWGVGRVADETGDASALVMRADTDGSSLSSAALVNGTSLSVATPSGPLWTTDTDDFPLYLSVGGIPVRATACSGSSSPQTFTVDPLPRARSSGAPVALWDPRPVGLG